MAEPKIIPVTNPFLVKNGDTFIFEEEIYEGTNYSISNIAPATYSITAPATPGSLVYRDSLNHLVQTTASATEQLQSNFDHIIFSAAVPGNEDCSGVIQ